MLNKGARWSNSKRLAVLVLVLGLFLLIFMITIEDEPGALPLMLIVASTIWLLIINYRNKKSLINNKTIKN